jgi:hypothetical protein
VRISVDIDGVLASEEKTFERCLAHPLEGAKDTLQFLKNQGHEIFIHTSRGWPEFKMTIDWLDKNQIPYDHVELGKPIADKRIDDKAIRFTSWSQVINDLAKDGITDEDEYLVYLARLATRRFMEHIARSDLMEPILEVGPMTMVGRNAKVFERMPETFVDSRVLFQGKQYLSMDMDESAGPDIVGDFINITEKTGSNYAGSLIAVNILEHIPTIWDVTTPVRAVLKAGGRAFFLTPFNHRLHGPSHDSWRLTDLAYRALFDHGFTIESIEKLPCPGRPLAPLGFTCVVRKN